ncbi:MAG: thioredoxin domain-containing protein, partial [Gemmataceae bacterium]|nr:thioredoxin domain-containing protein [Gemmataceae bacterium]
MTVGRLARAGLCLVLAAAAGATAADPKKKDVGKPNRLAKESSPYLLQHARNPVDWYPWGPEAFERAKKEGKLVFLSVGYSACHWCHVMERESFADPAVAKVLNENFVCIKVDREERPDLDDLYLTAVNVAGHPGGWPLSVFLTPEGRPIFGGTYFPPEDRKDGDDTIPGFKTVLRRVIDLHATERDGLYKQADRIAAMTADALERAARGIAIVTLDRELVADAARAVAVDPEHGGIGNKGREFRGAKFPRAPAWAFLLEQSRPRAAGRKPDGARNDDLAKAVRLTLHKMAGGGIYDHLGGGFHRYSTERTWTVPHFEKMLSDNAQLVELYAEAYRADPDPLYKRVVAETLGFVGREMTGPAGAFYSALDADSDGREGEYYVWTPGQIKDVLGNDADVAFVRAVYGVAEPNFEGKAHILRLPKPVAEVANDLKMTEAGLLARLGPLKAKLLAARGKRERPFLDTKVITAWNGQMVAAYARAGEVFGEKAYTAAAARAA